MNGCSGSRIVDIKVFLLLCLHCLYVDVCATSLITCQQFYTRWLICLGSQRLKPTRVCLRFPFSSYVATQCRSPSNFSGWVRGNWWGFWLFIDLSHGLALCLCYTGWFFLSNACAAIRAQPNHCCSFEVSVSIHYRGRLLSSLGPASAAVPLFTCAAASGHAGHHFWWGGTHFQLGRSLKQLPPGCSFGPTFLSGTVRTIQSPHTHHL